MYILPDTNHIINDTTFNLNNYQIILFDLDETLCENLNVLGLNTKLYDKSKELINNLTQNNNKVYIVTNNCRYTSKILETFFIKNNIIGITEQNIITPLTKICQKFKNKTILICCSKMQKNYLEECGINIYKYSQDELPDAIVFHDIYSYNYEFIIEYSKVIGINKDIPVYLSDNDITYKNNGIIFPDMGMLIKGTGCTEFTVIGKPNPNYIDMLTIKDISNVIMIGDSNTDYNFSKNIGCDFIHIKQENLDNFVFNNIKMCYEFNSIKSLYIKALERCHSN
jgi:ribonucleotide monophosphatase NagD (HAD superfamily)